MDGGAGYHGREHFSTGPVVGFEVADLAAATSELRRAGVELLGDPGQGWQHFRGPDSNVYELVATRQQVTELPAMTVMLPGGQRVALATHRWVLARWTGEADPAGLPRIWTIKPGFMVGGRRSCAELAVADRLRREGWDAVGSRHLVAGCAATGSGPWFPHPGRGRRPRLGGPGVRAAAYCQWGQAQRLFDVFAWRAPGEIRFVEVKLGTDRLRATQGTFLQTALRFHRLEQFMIVQIAS